MLATLVEDAGGDREGAARKGQMLKPGTVIADKYRVERMLGRGGMGIVVEAHHLQIGTPFALKFLHRSIATMNTVPERFLREARAAAAIGSEHVCRVFDVGTYEGAPFLVMELLEGTDLEHVLRREGPLPVARACSYLIQACAGIADAHAAQIVHRDLKPGNLFLARRPDGTQLVKVLDFGIAKAPQDTDLGLTGTDTILGSPAYMSLEQLRSSKLVDARSDIWSLGVILFELVSGRRPFHGEGVADLALRIAMEPIPLLSAKQAGGLAHLDPIIARCLAREPEQRYRDVGELARALAPFAGKPERRLAQAIGRFARGSVPPGAQRRSQPRPAVAIETELAAGLGTTIQTSGAIERAPAPRRARWLAPAVLVGSVAGGIALGLVALNGGEASPEPQVASAHAAPAEPAPAPPAPAPAPAPVAPAAPAPVSSPAEAPTITLQFTIEPAGAAVELDEVFVPARHIKVRKDGAPHRLRITAPGFAAYEREMRFDESQLLSVRLAQRPLRPVARRSTPPAAQGSARIESDSPYQ